MTFILKPKLLEFTESLIKEFNNSSYNDKIDPLIHDEICSLIDAQLEMLDNHKHLVYINLLNLIKNIDLNNKQRFTILNLLTKLLRDDIIHEDHLL